MKQGNPPLQECPITLRWSRFEQLLIRAMIEFANLEGPPEPLAAEKIFAPWRIPLWVPLKPQLELVSFHPESWSPERHVADVATVEAILVRAGDPENEKSILRWHAHLRIALTGRAAGGDATVESSFQDFAEKTLEGMPIHLGLANGEIVCKLSVDGPAAGWSLGWLMLRAANYPVRLCEECKYAFFVIFDGRKHKQKYCAECGPEVARLQTIKRSAESKARKRKRERGKK